MDMTKYSVNGNVQGTTLYPTVYDYSQIFRRAGIGKTIAIDS